jgi:transcriptional regulator with XRE-family HTH domain
MSLARRVRRSLKAKGLTQQDLVNRTGLSQAHISHVMTGRILSVRSDDLFKIADAIGVDPRWLATGAQ